MNCCFLLTKHGKDQQNKRYPLSKGLHPFFFFSIPHPNPSLTTKEQTKNPKNEFFFWWLFVNRYGLLDLLLIQDLPYFYFNNIT